MYVGVNNTNFEVVEVPTHSDARILLFYSLRHYMVPCLLPKWGKFDVTQQYLKVCERATPFRDSGEDLCLWRATG